MLFVDSWVKDYLVFWTVEHLCPVEYFERSYIFSENIQEFTNSNNFQWSFVPGVVKKQLDVSQMFSLREESFWRYLKDFHLNLTK